MKQLTTKCYFTLMELLVVFLILSFAAALTGVKIQGVYKEQQLLSEFDQILNQLSTAQDLMLMMSSDVKVIFDQYPETRQLQMHLNIEKPLDATSRKLIERRLTFERIKSVTFKNDKETTYTLPLTVNFSLGKMSRGKLTFSERAQGESGSSIDDDSNEFSINLEGSPAPIKKAIKVTGRLQTLTNKSELLYPVEVYEKIYDNPHENKKFSS